MLTAASQSNKCLTYDDVTRRTLYLSEMSYPLFVAVGHRSQLVVNSLPVTFLTKFETFLSLI